MDQWYGTCTYLGLFSLFRGTCTYLVLFRGEHSDHGTCTYQTDLWTDHRYIYALAIAFACTNVPLSSAHTWTLFHQPRNFCPKIFARSLIVLPVKIMGVRVPPLHPFLASTSVTWCLMKSKGKTWSCWSTCSIWHAVHVCHPTVLTCCVKVVQWC